MHDPVSKLEWAPVWHLSPHIRPLPKILRRFRLRNPIVMVFVFCEYSVGREYHAKNGMWINPLTGRCSSHEILTPYWERCSILKKVCRWWMTRS